MKKRLLKTILILLVVVLFISLITKEKQKEYTLLNKFSFMGKNISLLKDVSQEENLILVSHSKKDKIYSLKKKDYLSEDYVDSFLFHGVMGDYIVVVTKWGSNNSFSEDDGYTISIIDLETRKNLNKDEQLLWFGKWLDDRDSINEYIPYNAQAKDKILKELEELKKKGKI